MKIKRCPSCGNANRISNIICAECGEDLLRVPISNATDSEAVGILNVTRPETEPRFFRKCPKCGAVRPYSESRCECGMFLLTVPPFDASSQEESASNETARSEVAPESQSGSSYFLRSEDGRCVIPLSEDSEYILGRRNTGSEYLAPKSFVSGAHAKIRVVYGDVILEHIGSTNPTMVNGNEITPNTPIVVEEGDLISLGARAGQGYTEEAAYFRLCRKMDV